MPNRIIRESICTSDTVNDMSFFEEVVFYRLLVNADDYGRFDARPDILKARLFPLKRGVSANQIQSAIAQLEDLGTLYVYDVDQKPYLQIVNWEKYQRVRNSVEKYPAPVTTANSPQLAATRRKSPPESESESESESIKRECARARTTPTKQYGEYKNVLLTDEELAKLKAEYPDWQARIERLSEYIASKGVKYKSHYATIRSWANKDAKERKSETPKGNFDTDEFFEAALKKTMESAEKLMAKGE